MGPPEVVGLAEKLVKNVQRKMESPEGVGIVERLVKNVQRKMESAETVGKQRGGGCVVSTNEGDKKTPADGSISRRFIS